MAKRRCAVRRTSLWTENPSVFRVASRARGLFPAYTLNDSVARKGERTGHGTFRGLHRRLRADGRRSYFARVLEVPDAFCQGRDVEEAREMLRDALLLTLETNREEAERELEGRRDVTRGILRV